MNQGSREGKGGRSTTVGRHKEEGSRGREAKEEGENIEGGEKGKYGGERRRV